ncbi:hypothetical protein JT358_15690 [Micrococcales bacterium 31B]|nr:hypothetical protein [Micrococcales bacterium 31B]
MSPTQRTHRRRATPRRATPKPLLAAPALTAAAGLTALLAVTLTPQAAHAASDPNDSGGACFIKLPYNDALFAPVRSPGAPPLDPSTHWEHYNAEGWAAAGYPVPRVVDRIPGMTYVKQNGLPHIYGRGFTTDVQLSFLDWVTLGTPQPTSYDVQYVKYPWQPEVYAVSFVGENRDTWLWHQLSFEEWVGLGQPAPRTAGWIEGSEYTRVDATATAPAAFFVTLNGVKHHLTFAEWVAAGQPLDPNVEVIGTP